MLEHRQADRHEDCTESHLQQGQGLKRNLRRHMTERDAVECESNRTSEREHVAKINCRKIRKETRDSTPCGCCWGSQQQYPSKRQRRACVSIPSRRLGVPR